ncbi:MAG: hypothetical protein AAFX07_17910, partial [Pseudomonadota bacterium]
GLARQIALTDKFKQQSMPGRGIAHGGLLGFINRTCWISRNSGRIGPQSWSFLVRLPLSGAIGRV